MVHIDVVDKYLTKKADFSQFGTYKENRFI